MPSETFYCPGCKRQLTKSPQAYVLGEIESSGGSAFMFGSPARAVTCPGCGAPIDAQKMVRGEYDRLPGAFGAAANATTFIVWIAAWIAISGYGDAPWWAGGLLGLVIGSLAGALVQKITGPRKK
jgi:hypothetical protein